MTDQRQIADSTVVLAAALAALAVALVGTAAVAGWQVARGTAVAAAAVAWLALGVVQGVETNATGGRTNGPSA